MEDKNGPQMDTGLGLKEFLDKGKTNEAPQQKVETVAEPVKADKPDVGKQVETPVKVAKPEGLEKDGEKVKSPPQPESKDTGPNWDDEGNPWKAKAAQYEKRYKDTHSDWNRVNQEKIQAQRQQETLARQIAILNDKFDGTYDEAKYASAPVDPAHYHQVGTIEGTVKASLAAANRAHGADVVMQSLERYAEIFGNDRGVQERNLMSDDPIQGAMEAVKHHDFFSKFGTSPDSIQKRFREEFETNELPKMQAEVEKRVRAELAKQDREPRGIGQVLGASGATDKAVAKENAGRAKSLGTIFGK